MSGAYSGAIGGRLKLKGGVDKKKKRRRKREHIANHLDATGEGDGGVEGQTQDMTPSEPVDATGEIMTSGTTVMGSMGTKFKTEIERGDIIVIEHPKTQDYESRTVNMVLSDVSLSLSEPFSEDLLKRTAFKVQRIPRAPAPTEAAGKEEGEAGSTSKTFKYREKSNSAFGGYVIKTAKLGHGQTSTELLRMREKKKSDRYCM